MSRQRKTVGDGVFENIVELASMIPWWATLPVALLLFFFVPSTMPSEVNLQSSGNLSGVVINMFLVAFFKYFLPASLVFGSVLNIYSSLKSRFLFESINKKGASATIKDLTWQDFEFLLSEWFKKEGFSTELTGGGGADGGIDIKLYKDGGLYLVQCKHYKSWKVPVTVVRELLGVMSAENAVGGYVVTSGKFTKDAVEFAKGKNIELIDGNALNTILDITKIPNEQPSLIVEEICPRCGAQLVERNGKFGKFFGCSTYPKCQFTESVNPRS